MGDAWQPDENVKIIDESETEDIVTWLKSIGEDCNKAITFLSLKNVDHINKYKEFKMGSVDKAALEKAALSAFGDIIGEIEKSLDKIKSVIAK